MLLEPTVGQEAQLAEALQRGATVLGRRERIAELTVAAGYAATAAGLLFARPPHNVDVVAVLIALTVLAAATLVQFHVPSGFTVPTQLAFVPLLFVVSPSLSPVAVTVALVLSRSVEVLQGRCTPGRLLSAVGNSWFAIGPAAVFVALDDQPSRAGLAVLILALGAQFAIDFAVSTARTAIESGTNLREQLAEIWIYAVDAALSPVGLLVAIQVHRHAIADLALLPLFGIFASFARERRARLEGLIELKDAYHGTALVLGDVIEADDGYTGEHCKSVVQLALEVGGRLGLNAERLRNLEFAALLHDVGKVAISKEIINKAGKLEKHEWMLVQTHTVEGQRMLERVGGIMRAVGAIVRSHHERWDGTGYPDGLAGEDIPLESRIIACCDSWNAMRTDRAYREALPHEEAVSELEENSGTQFDPHIVDALLHVIAEPAWTPESVTRSQVPERG